MRWGLMCVAACAGRIESVEDYAAERAEAECRQIRRCQKGAFERDFSGIDECIEDTSAVIEDEVEFLELLDCEYLPEHAALCVSRMATNSVGRMFRLMLASASIACSISATCWRSGEVVMV